jgi:alpha-amylase
MWLKSLFVLLFVLLMMAGVGGNGRSVQSVSAQSVPRTVFVHLFEWQWTDVAQECENFLGPKGYSAVQVSPPNEHAVVSGRPWWERYQPVSYQIESRSGTRAEFADMVARCNAVGVDIYVDAVINHTTGVGSGVGINGSTYTDYNYPGLYSYWDFHHCGRNGNDDIQNYGDRWEVQNCELVNLADLNTGSSYVQDQIVAYMNDLISLGVDGFRLDASKHMDTNEIQAIVSRLNGNPYIFQEVIDQGGEPITAGEYFQNGDVTEFKYSINIGNTFYNGQLAWLNQFGTAWGMMPSDKAVVFTDNHDNQRGHGGGGHVVTYKDGKLYDLANVFMLAWPYGYPKVMSSYAFSDGDQGPPSDANGNTNDIYVNGTPNCFNEWKCEHRWRPIANMVAFRNYTAADFTVDNWWSNGGNQIAFSRGDSGFVAINKESYGLYRTFQTGLPAGTYCDVIHGDFENGVCSGPTTQVNGDGTATIYVASWDAVALHAGAKLGSACNAANVTFNVANATTFWGQNVYVVGSVPELGNWNTSNAVLLSPTNYPTWSGTVGISGNTAVAYKFIKMDGSGNVEWQSGADRTLTTTCGGSLTTNDNW